MHATQVAPPGDPERSHALRARCRRRRATSPPAPPVVDGYRGSPCTIGYTGAHDAVPRDIDLRTLIADTEAEIRALVRDRDPSTAGVYEMVRYHLGLDGSAVPRGKRMRPLLGPARLRLDHRRPRRAPCPARRPWSWATTSASSTTTSRTATSSAATGPTLWALHGIPQAINTGDMLFSLSRIALHRLTDLGFSDAKVLRLMRLYDETCVALCEGQYIDIWTGERDDADVGRALLRHDRPQDRGPDLGLDRGRRAARDRRRRR